MKKSNEIRHEDIFDCDEDDPRFCGYQEGFKFFELIIVILFVAFLMNSLCSSDADKEEAVASTGENIALAVELIE